MHSESLKELLIASGHLLLTKLHRCGCVGFTNFVIRVVILCRFGILANRLHDFFCEVTKRIIHLGGNQIVHFVFFHLLTDYLQCVVEPVPDGVVNCCMHAVEQDEHFGGVVFPMQAHLLEDVHDSEVVNDVLLVHHTLVC